MNLIEKTVAVLVSTEVNIWHFPAKKEGPRFYLWVLSEPDNKEGYTFDSYDALIEAAYAHIDPLLKPLPDKITAPPQALA